MQVSVVIPLYNKSSTIARAINSVLNQTFNDFEVIIVDDGSTDNSAKVVSEFNDSRILLFQQANQGPGAARNKGIELSNGYYISFLDADDEWLPGFLEESLNLLCNADDSTAAIFSGYIEYPSNKSMENLWYHRNIKNQEIVLSSKTPSILMMHFLAYMNSWTGVVRRAVFEQWGGFYDLNRCTYGEDTYLWIKVLLNERVLFNLKPLAIYHRESSELSNLNQHHRSIEPFLIYPENIYDCCPNNLQLLLTEFLKLRAFKAASVLMFTGRRQEALSLIQKFFGNSLLEIPFYGFAILGSMLKEYCIRLLQ